MMKKVFPIVAIYALVAVAWVVLGSSISYRTWSADGRLKDQVAALWGDSQTQVSPELSFHWPETTTETERVEDAETKETRYVTREKKVWQERAVILDRSQVNADLRLEQRKKGLLWYATYEVGFDGTYAYVHEDDREGLLWITYRFPTANANYFDFEFEVNGVVDPKAVPVNEDGGKLIRQSIPVRRGTVVPFRVAYRSRGLDTWRYSFGQQVNRVKNFDLSMTTDFREIDFPQGSISPDAREEIPAGWRLRWRSENLISGFQIGMDMPRRLNPGPLAATISYFAPISLGFFFVWIFVITLMERVRLHPMNYLFLAAAFFSFHLLFAFTVDHIELIPAFLIAASVSVFLVVSYLRLVAGLRFAALEAGGSQVVYLVLFSYAHFFQGLTGLIVTIGSILTLFLLMQLTGRTRWEEKFAT